MVYISFICGVFNDAVSIYEHVVSSNRIISKYRIGKDIEGNGRGLVR
jgi:hypothetical protein